MRRHKLLKIHLLSFSLILLVSIIACYGILFTEGLILYGDFTLPISLQKFFDMHYPLWNQYGSTNSFEFVARLSFRTVPLAFATIVSMPVAVFYKIMLLSTIILAGLSMYFSFFYLVNPSFTNSVKKTCIGAITASLIYMFNFKAIHTIIWPTLQFAYAVAPIALVCFIKLTLTPKFKYAFLAALLMTLIAGSPHYFVFTSFLMISWFAYSMLTNRFANITPRFVKMIFLFMLLVFLFNSFWFLPFIYSTVSGITQSPNYILTCAMLDILSRNSAIINTFRLTDIWWQHSSIMPENAIFQHIWTVATFVLPIFAFSSLIVSKEKIKQFSIFFGLISIVFIFLATGTNNGLSTVYSWLTFNLYFGWLLRAPNKLTMIVAMMYSFLIGITLISIPNVNWKKTIAVAMALMALFGISIAPMATGYLYNIFTPVCVPYEYYEANEFISDTEEYKALWLPLSYSGTVSWAPGKIVGPIDIRSSSIPTIGSIYPNSKKYLEYVTQILLENKSKKISSFISILNIKYILFHDDTSAHYNYSIYKLIEGQDGIRLLKKDNSIYIFENLNFSEHVNIPWRNILLTGGLNRFASLTAIDSFNPIDSCLIFLDQIPLEKNDRAHILTSSVLIGGTNSLDVSISLSEEILLIAPFDATNHAKPSEFWSKASPTISSEMWYDYLKKKNIENWDFDYGKGFVYFDQSTERPISMSIPVTIERTDDYIFLARYLENRAGGEIEICFDNRKYNISTKSTIDKFLWRQIDTILLEEGTYEVNLTSIEGFNAVNLFSLIPKNEFEKSQRLISEIFQKKRFICLLEDSDFYYKNATISREHDKKPSNGEILTLNENSTVWQNISIMKSDNYNFAVRFQGALEVKIDEMVFLINSNNLDWNYLNPTFIDKGVHKIEITTPTSAELDMALLYSLQDLDEKIDDIFTATQYPAEILSCTKLDPTKLWVKVNATQPFTLVFAEAYDPLWVANIDDETFSSVPIYSIVNGFQINKTGTLEILLEYEPQRWFYHGATISAGAFLACIAYSVWPCVRKRWKIVEFIKKRVKILFPFLA